MGSGCSSVRHRCCRWRPKRGAFFANPPDRDFHTVNTCPSRDFCTVDSASSSVNARRESSAPVTDGISEARESPRSVDSFLHDQSKRDEGIEEESLQTVASLDLPGLHATKLAWERGEHQIQLERLRRHQAEAEIMDLRYTLENMKHQNAEEKRLSCTCSDSTETLSHDGTYQAFSPMSNRSTVLTEKGDPLSSRIHEFNRSTTCCSSSSTEVLSLDTLDTFAPCFPSSYADRRISALHHPVSMTGVQDINYSMSPLCQHQRAKSPVSTPRSADNSCKSQSPAPHHDGKPQPVPDTRPQAAAKVGTNHSASNTTQQSFCSRVCHCAFLPHNRGPCKVCNRMDFSDSPMFI